MRVFTARAIPLFLRQRPPGGPGRFYPFKDFQAYYDFQPVPGFHVVGAKPQHVFEHFVCTIEPVFTGFSVYGGSVETGQFSYFTVQQESMRAVRFLHVGQQKAIIGFEVLENME